MKVSYFASLPDAIALMEYKDRLEEASMLQNMGISFNVDKRAIIFTGVDVALFQRAVKMLPDEESVLSAIQFRLF